MLYTKLLITALFKVLNPHNNHRGLNTQNVTEMFLFHRKGTLAQRGVELAQITQLAVCDRGETA